MSTPAIVLGDPTGILRLPKSAMRSRNDWTQLDSDILAHFIQVQKQLQLSRWNGANVKVKTQGDELLECSLPGFEDFVFAAVYFRQLIATEDRLLKDAVDRYCKFVDCRIRTPWIRHELAAFQTTLDGKALLLPAFSVRELFDAFIYGSALFHNIPKVNKSTRKRLVDIYDGQPRHVVLYALHGSLKMLMNYVGAIAAVVYRDYSHWVHDYDLPPPNIRWHDRLLSVPH